MRLLSKSTMVLALTLLISIFMYGGWFAPTSAQAALQYVGGASGTGTGATYSVSLTALTGGIGTAAAAGDLVIVVTGWASAADGNPGVTTPTGYTEAFDLYAGDTRDANLSVNWKIMGASPDTTVTVSGFNNAANGGATAVHVWRGADINTPMDVTPTSISAANNAGVALPNSPAITPVTAGAYVLTVGLGTGAAAPTAFTAPAGYANTRSAPGAGSTMGAIANIASVAWTSGPVDPAAWTGTTSASDSWCAGTLAIRPATPPTLTTPSAITVASTTATLGATVSNNGGATLSARGTVWNTTTVPTANQLAEGGTTVSAYSHSRTALTAQTRIYYRGYATNPLGTSYSPEGSFYTEPATQAAAVTFSGITSSGMTVNWTRGSGGAGGGVIVLMKAATAVNSDPVDGTYTTYTASAAYPGGSQLGTGNYVVYKGTGTSVAVTGLSPTTTYHVAVYEFAGQIDTAGDAQGTNYKLTPAVNNQATPAAPFDTLTVTANVAVATTAAPLATNVQMQRLQLDSNNGDNGNVVISSITVDDLGTAGATDITNLRVTLDVDNIYNNANELGTVTQAGFNGSSTVVSLLSLAVGDRTVSFGTPKYIWITYDLASSADTKTIQSSVTAIAVVASDAGAIGTWNSNIVNVTSGPDSTINSCAGCHGYPSPLTDSATRNATTGQFVGDHAKHNYVCSTCHVTPVTETGTDYAHRDGNINIKSGTIGLADNGTYSRGSSFAQSNNPVTGTCNSVNCHSNAVTPQWGVGVTACDTCHGLPPATNAHTKHYTEKGWATGSNAMCIVCHPNNLAGHSDVTDNAVEVTLTPAGVSPAITCASANASGCHIDKTTPAWNTTNIACLACHTLGGASNNPTSGLHNVVPSVSAEQHDDSFDSAGGTCISCHTTLAAQSTHANTIFSANGFVPGDKTAMGLAAFYTATADDIGTCVNTTCHLGNSDAWAHKWMATANYTNATNSCTGCHGMDLTVTNLGVIGVEHLAVTAKHNVTATNYKCKDCHAIESASGYAFTFGTADWSNRGETTLHGNNLITINDDVAGAGGNITGWQRGTAGNTAKSLCLKCHASWVDSAPQHWATNTLWTTQEVTGDTITSACGECHTGGVTPVGASGAHIIHGANTTDLVAGGAACVPCHGNNGGLGYQNSTAGTHGVGGVVNFTGVNYSTAVRNDLAGTCNTSSCHNYDPVIATPTKDRSTAWNTTALACDDCHYYATTTTPTTAGNTAHGRPLSADHGIHFSTGGTFACADCHGADPIAGDTAHISGATSLTDKAVAVAFEATISAAAKGTGNDQLTTGTATTCNSAACHNPSGTAYSANWDVSTSSCTLCHVATSGNPTTGDHTDHLTRSAVFGRVIVCADCHVVPVSNRHMNGLPDVQVRSVAGVFGAVASPTIANGCGTNECHNSGSATAPINTTYLWGNATTITDCLECHENGATMATNAHNEHMNTGYTGAACTDCHTAATNTLHMNRIVNIDGTKATYSLNTGAVPIATVPNGTCVTSGCHNRAVASIAWNVAVGTVAGTTDLTCTSCHGNGAGAGLSASHEDHFTAGKACTQCHGAVTTTTHITGKTSLTDGANAVLGEAGLIWTDGTALTDYTYNTTEHSCYSATNNGLGCHATAGAAGAADATRPDWDIVFASTACINCHTNKTTAAVNPTSGLHGVVPTVSGMQHDEAFATGGTCSSCHPTVPVSGTHKNGTFTGDGSVAGDRTNMGLATFYTNGGTDNTGTCATTTCHLGGATQSDAWAHVWNSTLNYYTTNTTACAGCHGDKTTGFNAGVDHRSRGPHTDGATYGCAVCHALEAVSGTYTFTWNTNDWGGTSKHGNSTIEVNTNGTYNTTSNLCTACHSTSDGVHNFVDTTWTVANLLGDAISGGSCLGCHGATVNTSLGAVTTNTAFPAGGSHAGNFGMTVKHLSGTIVDAQCEVCHSTATQPMNTGSANRDKIQLKDPDTGTVIVIDQALAETDATRNLNTVTFCSKCHDAGGATSSFRPTFSAANPFGTGVAPKDVATMYTSTVTGITHNYAYNNTPQLVKARSPHGKPTTNVMKNETARVNFAADTAPVGCQSCHPSHGGAALNPVPTITGGTDINSTIVNASMMLTGYSEPGSCWTCHNAAGVKDYYGDSTVAGNNWVGIQKSSFAYKNRNYLSRHQVQLNTFTPTRANARTTADDTASVSCSVCHNPHGSPTWVTAGAVAYQSFSLRGNWMTSPYLEDRASQNSATTSALYASTALGPRTSSEAAYNRPATLGHGYSAAGGSGWDGYFIDQNTFGAATKGYPTAAWTKMTDTAANFAGLCANCHAATVGAASGGTVATMQAYLNAAASTGVTDWSATAKVHNTVNGWYVATNSVDQVNFANNPTMRLLHSANPDAIRVIQNSTSFSPRVEYAWGLTLVAATKQQYHNFSCSKCHTPHASSLPRLMISNCLDVGTGTTARAAMSATYNNVVNPSRYTYTYPTYSVFAGSGSANGSATAQHCHNAKKTNKAAGGGWNQITGW